MNSKIAVVVVLLMSMVVGSQAGVVNTDGCVEQGWQTTEAARIILGPVKYLEYGTIEAGTRYVHVIFQNKPNCNWQYRTTSQDEYSRVLAIFLAARANGEQDIDMYGTGLLPGTSYITFNRVALGRP